MAVCLHAAAHCKSLNGHQHRTASQYKPTKGKMDGLSLTYTHPSLFSSSWTFSTSSTRMLAVALIQAVDERHNIHISLCCVNWSSQHVKLQNTTAICDGPCRDTLLCETSGYLDGGSCWSMIWIYESLWCSHWLWDSRRHEWIIIGRSHIMSHDTVGYCSRDLQWFKCCQCERPLKNIFSNASSKKQICVDMGKVLAKCLGFISSEAVRRKCSESFRFGHMFHNSTFRKIICFCFVIIFCESNFV